MVYLTKNNASAFFTNEGSNTLYKKFEIVFQNMQNIEYFKSVIGILRLIQDIAEQKTEINAHNSKKLHSKFYILLSPNFNEHNPNGMVIMGSSNLSAQGLGLENVENNHERNVELRDYENVKFADYVFHKVKTDLALDESSIGLGYKLLKRP